MTYEEFLSAVEIGADVGRERAESATRAVLETLAERIAEGEARDVAAQLPAELAPSVATTTPAEGFDVDEFIRRIAEREEVDVETAERHAAAVLQALAKALTAQEFADLVAELPKDFGPLLPRGPAIGIVSATSFFDRVADRAGIEPEEARRATVAVLETLAERIAGGEVDDLIARLPGQLHPPLREGVERGGEPAQRMGLDEFLRRVAARARVTPDRAREYARAVLATLREAVGDKEFFDVSSELPGEYAELLTARRQPI